MHNLIAVKLRQKIRTTQINKELKRQASLADNDPSLDAKRWGDVLMDPERCCLISFQGFLKLMKNGNVLSQIAQHLASVKDHHEKAPPVPEIKELLRNIDKTLFEQLRDGTISYQQQIGRASCRERV